MTGLPCALRPIAFFYPDRGRQMTSPGFTGGPGQAGWFSQGWRPGLLSSALHGTKTACRFTAVFGKISGTFSRPPRPHTQWGMSTPVPSSQSCGLQNAARTSRDIRCNRLDGPHKHCSGYHSEKGRVWCAFARAFRCQLRSARDISQ